jgi:hypothetical protein
VVVAEAGIAADVGDQKGSEGGRAAFSPLARRRIRRSGRGGRLACGRWRVALRCGWKLLAEDRLLELLERRARVDPELLDERSARVPVDLERLRLAARAVEREHELGAEALAERVRGDELLQLSDDFPVPAEGEIGLDRRSSAARRNSSSRPIAVCANCS